MSYSYLFTRKIPRLKKVNHKITLMTKPEILKPRLAAPEHLSTHFRCTSKNNKRHNVVGGKCWEEHQNTTCCGKTEVAGNTSRGLFWEDFMDKAVLKVGLERW